MTRLRDLGISIGRLPTGQFNAITDVEGILVGHASVVEDSPTTVRTGVTMILPRNNEIWTNYAFCGWHSFNGNGEMTGIPWIEESGMLGSPIGITNTHQVGLVRDALVRYGVEAGVVDGFHLPVVAETYDGWLSDIDSFRLTESDVRAAIASAASGPVAEGNVGGGTGMICHEFKGGIGTSSRVVDLAMHTYTVGVLVQANYGSRHDLRIDGVPVGRAISYDKVPAPWPTHERDGRSSWSLPLMLRCSRINAGGSPAGPRSDWLERGGPVTTAPRTSSCRLRRATTFWRDRRLPTRCAWFPMRCSTTSSRLSPMPPRRRSSMLYARLRR